VLRQVLDTALGSGASEATFRFEDGILSLLPSVWVDIHEFERLCSTQLPVSYETRLAQLSEALDLYRGDLLPDDRYEEWVLNPRERLYRCLHTARLDLAKYHRDHGDYSFAISVLIPLLERDRADEHVHRELMRLYALSGQKQAALRQYQVCEQALSAEIEAPPAPETAALYAQILHDELTPQLTLPPELAVRPALPADDKPRPLFVGRQRELNLLQSHLQAAMHGDGGIIFITGEAGQGKTSLMSEFAHQALANYPELVIATGACQALTGAADPYLPFRDLIAMLTGDWQRPWLGANISRAQAQRLLSIAPQIAPALQVNAPDLVDVLVLETEVQARRTLRSPGLNQRQVFDQMGQFLRTLATQQPLLLLLDDLQWIDGASANLLFYLGRQLAHSPVLIIGAYRPSEVSRTVGGEHPLAPVVQELIRYRGEIQVDLDVSIPIEERRFIDALLDSEPNQLDASFREALYRHTKGNPLFAIELLRALQDQGQLMKNHTGQWMAADDLDWEILPARVEALIARRIGILSPEVRQFLDVACVEGETFSVEVIAQVYKTDVLRLLHQVSHEVDQRLRLVREQGEWRLGKQSITRYQFRHNLFQQYLYRQLGDAERRVLHREIAAALERIAGDELDRLAVSLAHHYLAAGEAARAVPYLCRAGDEARRRVALEEALQLYTSALDNWHDDDPAAMAQVLQKVGETWLALGNSALAIQNLTAANQLYAQVGNLTGMGAMQRLIGRSYFEQGDRAKALEHYHQVLSLLEGDAQNSELARAISAIAQMHMSANEYDEAIAWGERALSLARAQEIDDVILHALTTVGTALANKGEAERGLSMLAECQEHAVALGLPHDAGRAYAGWGDALVTLERYQEARSIYNRMLTYAQQVHTGMFEGVALVQLGYLDWWAGHWRRAWARRQEILDWMAIFPGASFAKVWASNFLGLIYNDVGQPDQAYQVLAEYAAVARSAHEPQTTVPHLGQLARCTGSPAQTAVLVQEIISLATSPAYPPYEVLPALMFAYSWVAQSSRGNPGALGGLEKAAMQVQNRQSAASLDEVRALCAHARGEREQAISFYTSAASRWEALQRPYDLLRTLGGLIRSLSDSKAINSRPEDQARLDEARMRSELIIDSLAGELDEPEVKQAFLASPLVMQIHVGRQPENHPSSG
jgi:predicted ATPase